MLLHMVQKETKCVYFCLLQDSTLFMLCHNILDHYVIVETFMALVNSISSSYCKRKEIEVAVNSTDVRTTSPSGSTHSWNLQLGFYLKFVLTLFKNQQSSLIYVNVFL